jgi:hypothetical protein
MCKNFEELVFTHFVIATAEGIIFGSAREEGGHIHNFLIRDGTVQVQEGDDWHELDPEFADIVRRRAQLVYGEKPVYRTRTLLY